jgi:hypothetical protein
MEIRVENDRIQKMNRKLFEGAAEVLTPPRVNETADARRTPHPMTEGRATWADNMCIFSFVTPLLFSYMNDGCLTIYNISLKFTLPISSTGRQCPPATK